MDSPFTRNALDSPFLRAQEAKHGQASSFSLGPAMHDTGGYEAATATDTSQGTADLTAFVQNLLQQMQSRFQSMSDAILVRIDEMASRIEDLERSVDDVLREVTSSYDDQTPLPPPVSSPIRRANAATQSPDVRKHSLGAPSSLHPMSPIGGRYSSSGSLASPTTSSLNASDSRRQLSSGSLNSPDFRRQNLLPPNSPNRQLSLPGSFGSTSPDVRKSFPTPFFISPDARRRSDTHLR